MEKTQCEQDAPSSPVCSATSACTSSSTYPIRRRRNPAVLIRWIEEHPYNPYPTKAEKHYLSFYAGMTQRQLNDWFANARRNIKKVGYDSWKKKHNGFSAILSGIPFQGLPFYTTGSLFSTGQPFAAAAIANTLSCRPSTSIAASPLQAHAVQGLANGVTGGQVTQFANGTLTNSAAASTTMSVASPATPPQYYTCTQEGQVSTMQLQVRSGTTPAAFVVNGGPPAVSDGVCYPPNSCIRSTIPLGMTWVPPAHPHLYRAAPDTPPATPCTTYSGQCQPSPLTPTPSQQNAATINGTNTPGEPMHAQWAPNVNTTEPRHVGYSWQMEVGSEENGSTAEENYYEDSPSNIPLCRS